MNLLTRHILIPTVAPALIVGLYFMPVSLVGCANRGLMALAIVSASLVAGVVTGLLGLLSGPRGGASPGWWMASTCILLLPALLVLGPLG